MGELILKGDRALDLVQYVTSNDASLLSDGKVQYSCLPNEEGGIVDDLLVYRIDEKTYMLVVNASNIEKDLRHLSEYNRFEAEILRSEEHTSALQSLMRISYAVFCLKNKKTNTNQHYSHSKD